MMAVQWVRSVMELAGSGLDVTYRARVNWDSIHGRSGCSSRSGYGEVVWRTRTEFVWEDSPLSVMRLWEPVGGMQLLVMGLD